MISPEEQEYVDKKRMKRLTFDNYNDLYNHPVYGARTIEECQYMDNIAANPPPKPKDLCEFVNVFNMEMSYEMYVENERFIQKHGFSMMSL